MMTKTLAVCVPAVHLTLTTSDGRTVWHKPLLDVTSLAVGAWVVAVLLSAVGQLVGAVFFWGVAYSALLFALLIILLTALLWGLTPRWAVRTPNGGRGC